MSRREQISELHKNQARHNYDLLMEPVLPPTNKKSSYRDWATTVSFYAALHYLQSYLSKTDGLKYQFSGHEERNHYLETCEDPKIQLVREDYIALYKASRSARYSPMFFNKQLIEEIQEHFEIAFNTIPNRLGL